jgi:hypothetical protein
VVKTEGLRDGNQSDFPGLPTGSRGRSGDAGTCIFEAGSDVGFEGHD